MSLHINAKKDDIAEKMIFPGDPMRAKVIAETYLEDAFCYNDVRGMLGYTGTYQGQRVSVQGHGMGMPSMSIYAHELFSEYGVQQIIRVGTTGAIQASVSVRDIILAQGACTDSNMNHRRFRGQSFAPLADFTLLSQAHLQAKSMKKPIKIGNVLTSDAFYGDFSEDWEVFAAYGVLCVEMETAALYTCAAKFNRQALALLTVSDHLVNKEKLTSDERQNGFMSMVEVALKTIVAV